MTKLGSSARDVIALAVLHNSLVDNEEQALEFADVILGGLTARGFLITTKEELLNHANAAMQEAGRTF